MTIIGFNEWYSLSSERLVDINITVLYYRRSEQHVAEKIRETNYKGEENLSKQGRKRLNGVGRKKTPKRREVLNKRKTATSRNQGRVEASQEDKKKGKELEKERQEDKKRRRRRRRYLGQVNKTARSPEVEKKSGREMEKILEKLEEVKREITEEIKEAEKRESRSQERNRTTKGRI
ncbi:hypothetical protein GEV33_001401 [Tenebrio molitor]|uniref:Uncharacterized protein n=1 Tax=Tenebrio molitor TaxID=7067 RepID=A0A8J6LGV0_TENMO|nr:hypothetical protein GEV33_001401 [Tenebrio molitor]